MKGTRERQTAGGDSGRRYHRRCDGFAQASEERSGQVDLAACSDTIAASGTNHRKFSAPAKSASGGKSPYGHFLA